MASGLTRVSGPVEQHVADGASWSYSPGMPVLM